MWLTIILIAAAVLLIALVARRKRKEAAKQEEPPPLLPLRFPSPAPRRQEPAYIPTRLDAVEPRPGDEPQEPGEVMLAGINHTNMAGVHRQIVIRRCAIGEEVILVRDRDNPYDGNAIRCLRLNGEDVGFVPAWYAEDLAPFMDRKQAVKAKVTKIKPFESSGGNDLLGIEISITKYKRPRKKRAPKAK